MIYRPNRKSNPYAKKPTLSTTFAGDNLNISGIYYESSSSEEGFTGASFPDRFQPPATGKKPMLPSLDFTKIPINPKNATDSALKVMRKSKYEIMLENSVEKV